MNLPYPIEPYNPYARGPRKKSLFEQMEEDEMFARLLAEQIAQEQHRKTACGVTGAGGHNDYDLLNVPSSNNWEDNSNNWELENSNWEVA